MEKSPLAMNREIIDEIYQATKSNLAKNKLLATYSSHIYKDFPANIPGHVEVEIHKDFIEVANVEKAKAEELSFVR